VSAYEFLVILQLVATLYMTGLIWFVQLVHYPLFSEVGHEAFVRYENAHNTRTSRVVLPAMLVELGSAIYLFVTPTSPWPKDTAGFGLALVVIIWLSTFMLQVPCHRRLKNGFDAVVHRNLVQTNWIRVMAWSMRAGLVVYMLDLT
jgi:hypothetical protein